MAVIAGDSVVLYDMSTGKKFHTITNPKGLVNDLVFTPDGKQLAVDSSNTAILLWTVPELRFH